LLLNVLALGLYRYVPGSASRHTGTGGSFLAGRPRCTLVARCRADEDEMRCGEEAEAEAEAVVME